MPLRIYFVVILISVILLSYYCMIFLHYYNILLFLFLLLLLLDHIRLVYDCITGLLEYSVRIVFYYSIIIILL